MPEQKSAIDTRFQILEDRKQELFTLLDRLPDNLYYQQPAQLSWSIGQVINHLYWSERNSLAYLKKKLSYPDSVPRYHWKSWAGILLIKLVFLTRFKVKAPASIDMWQVEKIFSPTALKTNWDDLRKELKAFIDQHQPVFGRHLAFRHPFAGRMTMYQMLIFFNDHIRHHQRQIRKIESVLKKNVIEPQ